MEKPTSRLDELRIDRPTEEPRGKGRWVVLAVLVVALLALALAWGRRPSRVEVRTSVAREVAAGKALTVLNASGYVTARLSATVSSKVTGKVVEVLIEEGMEVAKGEVLARLDDVNVRAALRLSEAQWAASRQEVEETRVRLAEARLDLKRTEELLASEIASQADLDRAQAEVDSLAARLETQREAVKVAEQRVALDRQSLDDTVIRAPFAGIVVTKDAQPGEMISPVSAGGGFTRTGIGTIVDMSSLEIEVDVNEAYIHRVHAGQRVEATLDAYPDWQIPCSVIAIVPTADRQTATVRVRIAFDELGDPRVLPDMGVKVGFRSRETEQAASSPGVEVPRSALRKDDGRDVVWVVDGGKVERRAVIVSPSTGEQALIAAGLTGGERVVVEGPSSLEDGMEAEEASP